MFWVISVYFNIRNTLPKFCPFLLGHCIYVWELADTRLLSFYPDPMHPSSIEGSSRDRYLEAPALFVILNTGDGGTLTDQVPGMRVRETDSALILAPILMFQN